MKKEFVPYDIALAMKELGYNEDCLGFWSKIHGLYITKTTGESKLFEDAGECKAPLYQQAFRWFREEYGITSWVEEDKHGFSYNLRGSDFTQTIKDTYREAELACLRKLIEIVKEKID
jgi:hypothetical protein